MFLKIKIKYINLKTSFLALIPELYVLKNKNLKWIKLRLFVVDVGVDVDVVVVFVVVVADMLFK